MSDGTQIRELERESIRGFLAENVHYIRGRTLDYGCGKSPYRDIVEGAGALYLGYDRSAFPANLSGFDVGDVGEEYDTIICTQVIQYIPNPYLILVRFGELLAKGGTLMMTGPVNWPEIEPDDLHRYTVNGISRLVTHAGFGEVDCWSRIVLDDIPGFKMNLGWALVARPGEKKEVL